MKTIGVAGCIGSGKSHICRLFEKHNIPVFYFDDEAKKLYLEPSIMKEMINVCGYVYEYNTYQDKKIADMYGKPIDEFKLNKQKLSSIIFSDDSKRIQVEKLLRPELMKVFYDEIYKCEYIEHQSLFIAESATMVKSNLYKNFDHII